MADSSQEIERYNSLTGRDRIKVGIDYLKNLNDQVKSGSLSQSEYVRLAGQIAPQVSRDANAFAGGGSRQASEAAGAGLALLNNELLPDFQIYQSGQEILGRDLTPQDFAAVKPYFGGPSGIDNGRSYLAELAKRESQSPEGLRKKAESDAPQYAQPVQDIFQELLKRGASQSEVDHFSRMLASGDVDEYTLRQFVQQLPEYIEGQDKILQEKQGQEDLAARQQLGSELGQYDQDFFNKAKENVISRYSKAGLLNSPSLDFALTDLMGNIQKERSAYLADIARRDYESARGFKREDYLGNKGLLREDYQTNLNRLFGQQDYGQQRSDQLQDSMLQRGWQGSDYATQRRDLEQLLSRQGGGGGGGGGGLGSLLGGIAGLGAGALTGGTWGGPAGVSAMYQMGSGLGGYFDANRRY